MMIAAAALALVACSDDGGGDDDGSAVDAGAGGDAAQRVDGGEVPDASTGPARNLGIPCPNDSCPDGEVCRDVNLFGDSTPDTGKFCTVQCAGSGDDTACEDGFPGPGDPTCFLSGAGGSLCAVLCDVQTATECPAGATCIDLTPDDGADTLGMCAPPLS